jgi:hypothetical protein
MNPSKPTANPSTDRARIPEDPAGDLLDMALARALAAPPVPRSFRERLAGSMLREAARIADEEIAARLRELELQRVKELDQLRVGQVRIYRGTLAIIVAAAFTAGAAVSLVLPQLHGFFGVTLVSAAPLLGLLAGLLAAGVVWYGDALRRRFLPSL